MHGYRYALAPKLDRIYRYEMTKARGAKRLLAVNPDTDRSRSIG